MSSVIITLIVLAPLKRAAIPFIPKDMAVTEKHIYLLGKNGYEIYELHDDSLEVIYSSESPLRSIDADPVFLYFLDREGLKVLTYGAERAGVLKGGRFRDLAVSEAGIIYLLGWEGVKLHVLDIEEEEYTLDYPAEKLECSPAGFLALGREKEIEIADSRGNPLGEIPGEYRDFALGTEGLYTASAKGIFRVQVDSLSRPSKLIGDSTIQLLDCLGDTVYYINARGEIYLIFPTN